MPTLPHKTTQIIQSHAALIVAVTKACLHPQLAAEAEPLLEMAQTHGWSDLVATLRQILSGNRDIGLIKGLDEEDGIIVEAVLRGIQNPSTLPDPNEQANGDMAAPGLAALIHAACGGDLMARQMISTLASQMSGTNGDMKRLGTAVARMVEGERDIDKLLINMDSRGEKLVRDILKNLDEMATVG